MIPPSRSSPLRPVIAAFYQTFHQARASWGKDDFSQTLRDVLAASGVSATLASNAGIDLVVDDRIGVVILPDARRLTDATRRSVREVLGGDGTPEVALIMAFLPRPRIARVDVLHKRAEEE